jgi:hypothetical protein
MQARGNVSCKTSAHAGQNKRRFGAGERLTHRRKARLSHDDAREEAGEQASLVTPKKPLRTVEEAPAPPRRRGEFEPLVDEHRWSAQSMWCAAVTFLVWPVPARWILDVSR